MELKLKSDQPRGKTSHLPTRVAHMTEEMMIRGLRAIMSADAVGYSCLMREDGTIRTITAYRNATAALIEKHRGRVVDD